MPDRLAMTFAERDAFLLGVHVAVLTVDEPGRGPLALPVWYEYKDRRVGLGMDGGSTKAKLLRAAGRATVLVQQEAFPYRYVSVEGPVAETDRLRSMKEVAIRYMGEEAGTAYAEHGGVDASNQVTFELQPEHWRTQDFSKAG